jgi:antitoxin MazE
MHAITLTIRAIGNSKGIVLPKPVLAQIGLEGASSLCLTVEQGAIVLRKPARSARVGWAEAAEAVAAQGGNELLLDEFGNQDDAELRWSELRW